MALTTHPYLAQRLKKEQSYTSAPLWTFVDYSRVNLTFIFTLYGKGISTQYTAHQTHYTLFSQPYRESDHLFSPYVRKREEMNVKF